MERLHKGVIEGARAGGGRVSSNLGGFPDHS